MADEKEVFMMVDIETTGLDPEKDEVLEIAAFPIDLETLDPTYPPFEKVLHFDPLDYPVGFMPPLVEDMHTKNHLLNECLSNSVSWGTAIADFADYLEARGASDHNVIPVGNSVHFDMGFLLSAAEGEPNPLKSLFSHRRMDCRTALYMVEAWTGKKKDKAESNHRALGDCYLSLGILRWCKAQLMG